MKKLLLLCIILFGSSSLPAQLSAENYTKKMAGAFALGLGFVLSEAGNSNGKRDYSAEIPFLAGHITGIAFWAIPWVIVLSNYSSKSERALNK